ncbi:MAG: beta-phosphoglucomutase [Anaerolineae bacterium]|nr:beta-phosphoglucomutase [Anaerolineae bacterium]
MPPEIHGLIFDLDGVITDTAEYHFLAWKRVADEEGIPFTREDNEALRGLSRRESLNTILKGRPIDEATAQNWMDRKNTYYLEHLEELTPANLLPGVPQLLDDARARGLKLGLGSASKNARLVVSRLGMESLFDVIGDGYCVVNAKPAPDLFLWVAGALRVYPTQAIVFEDAEAGINAARAGGFFTVGLGNAANNQPTIWLPSLEKASLGEILARLS